MLTTFTINYHDLLLSLAAEGKEVPTETEGEIAPSKKSMPDRFKDVLKGLTESMKRRQRATATLPNMETAWIDETIEAEGENEEVYDQTEYPTDEQPVETWHEELPPVEESAV